MRFTFYSTLSIAGLLASEQLSKVDATAVDTYDYAMDSYMNDYELAELEAMSEDDMDLAQIGGGFYDDEIMQINA